MNILAVGAHPDDVELTCAGTLAKYQRRGDKIYIAVLTDGGVGSNKIPQDKLVIIRRKEAEASAKHINAELIWMGYPDQFLFNNEETRKSRIDIVRKVAPDVILAPPLYDYHKFKPCQKTPHLYFVDTIDGLGFIPDNFVDIQDTIEIKKQMLLEHHSQACFMQDIWGMDFENIVEVTARYRGFQAGIKYAEGFQVCKLQPRVTLKNLLP